MSTTKRLPETTRFRKTTPENAEFLETRSLTDLMRDLPLPCRQFCEAGNVSATSACETGSSAGKVPEAGRFWVGPVGLFRGVFRLSKGTTNLGQTSL